MTWFSTYKGLDWDVNKHGYNELFAETVQQVRYFFRLKKESAGVDIGTGAWIDYRLQRRNYKVNVINFKWKDVTRYNTYITPHFRLELQIATSGGKPVFKGPLVIEFRNNFPKTPPRFRVDLPKYTFHYITNEQSIRHHLFRDGWFCMMNYDAEWESDVDTVVTGINRAFELIVLHVNNFGW